MSGIAPFAPSAAGQASGTGAVGSQAGGDRDLTSRAIVSGSSDSDETRLEDEKRRDDDDVDDEKVSHKDDGRGEERAGGVNVERAEADFAALSRKLTHTSTVRTDVERQEDEEDDFDLVAYLRGSADQRDRHGFSHKQLGVVFKNLKVVGAGGIKLHVRTFPNAIIEFFASPVFKIMMKIPKFLPPPKTILHDFEGVLKPGEMCLVLGRPGAGCSTFLKVIANQRVGFQKIEGEVTYGGESSELFGKQYKGEVVYNQEDDVHSPTLTVAQTLMFALQTKTPRKRMPNQTQKGFREDVLALLLRMLNIEHTRNTLVGNAQVRGVSGGERKRVSIAEMMATRGCVLSWDNTTRGLDASTALDYAKSLRIMTDVFKTTMFVSLYQAGEGIFDQFDKVLLIDAGRQVYFGPAKEARPYLISLGYKDLPRQTSADYLTGCTDENERRFADGVDVEKVPKTPEELEQVYRESAVHASMVKEREEWEEYERKEAKWRDEFKRAVSEDKRRLTGKRSPYTVSFFHQVWALTVRQARVKMQDRVGFAMGYFTSIVTALIAGSCYLNLPLTAAGAFTRGGVLFTALLFNSFNAFNELPVQMLGRPIMWKQSGYTFYRPGALTIAATLADLPFQFIQIVIFCIIIYFMTGLVRTAGAFFSFLAIVFMGFLSLASFFRLLGCVSFDFNVAARLAASLVTVMVIYSGYIIPVFSMKRWLFWLYYANPVNYAFGALMGNEFGRIDLACVGAYIVPNGASYPQTLGPNQVCTLRGAEPGNPVVSGSAYIEQGYRYHADDVWRNFGFLICYFILFAFIQFLATETLALGAGMPSINFFAKEDKERKKLNERLAERRDDYRSGKAQQDLSNLIQTRKPFTWENLTYDVPVSGGQKRLLDDVFGFVKPGELTALMGASGAGKTTLLDVLANRKNIGVIGGEICVAGRPPGKDFQRGTAYCEQLDVHEFTQTVREAMRFSAYLRQDPAVPIEEKNDYVEEIIQLLEMEDLADAMIGFPGFGLSVEARKRLTIGVELAAKPQLLLFLDEPTSGLDGQSAYNLVRFLRKLASAGQAILCTIHQPNALLFENFDRLLLLKRGGRTIYFGPIGKDSQEIRNYFERNGAPCPADANPAEFMLEAIGAGSKRRIGNKDWADRWADSPEHEANKREIVQIKQDALNQHDSGPKIIETEYATPFLTQLRFVVARNNNALWRNPDYQFTKMFNHAIIALVVGLTFLQVGNSTADLQFRVFAIFFASVMPALIISQIEPMWLMARDIFIRESSAKMYSRTVFALGQFVGECPYSVVCALVYFLLWYYPNGFNYDSNRAGYAFFMLLVVEFYSVTLGQAVASLSPSITVAAMVNPFLLVIFALFCGVTVPQPNLPGFWREWMYNLDPFTRLIAGLVVNELHDLPITCTPDEFYTFQPPSGQTCAAWAQSFIEASGGYLSNPNDSANCQYCQFAVGDEFFLPLGYNWVYRWRDLGIFIGFFFFNIGVTLFGAEFLTMRYAKR